MLRRLLTFALLFVLVLFVAQAASACPTCKDNLGDPASANLARGFYYSILFMLSMPYLILGCIGFYFYSLIRKARREREAAEAAAAQATLAVASEPSAVAQDELVGVS